MGSTTNLFQLLNRYLNHLMANSFVFIPPKVFVSPCQLITVQNEGDNPLDKPNFINPCAFYKFQDDQLLSSPDIETSDYTDSSPVIDVTKRGGLKDTEKVDELSPSIADILKGKKLAVGDFKSVNDDVNDDVVKNDVVNAVNDDVVNKRRDNDIKDKNEQNNEKINDFNETNKCKTVVKNIKNSDKENIEMDKPEEEKSEKS